MFSKILLVKRVSVHTVSNRMLRPRQNALYSQIYCITDWLKFLRNVCANSSERGGVEKNEQQLKQVFFGGGGVNFLKHINSPLYLFLGQVHATDYSNASATGIFDSYQVWHMYCVYSLFLWCEVLFLFLFSFFISLSCNFITDVLEWISLLAGLSASLHFPQSRKHRVSQPFPSNTN